MAVRTVSNTGGNWNATTAWVGGVVPLATDTVDFTATSGNLVVNANTAALSGINFTNYVGTITFNANINVQGSLNLGTGGYTQIGLLNGVGFFGTSNITCNGVICPFTLILAGTITLNDDLYFSNNFTASSVATTINNFNIYCIGGTLDGDANISGTSTFYFKGNSTWSTLYGGFQFRLNTIIDCETLTLPTLTNRYASYGASTIRYVRGIFNKNARFTILSNCTIIDFHKCIIDNIIVGQTITVTMNEFFSGSPSRVVNITSTTTTNYTIAFQDGFEKIAKFVNISSCTLSKPLQLLVLTKSKINSRNTGIRYINQSPNGIAKGEPSVNQTTFGASGLLPDPIKL
tara:strand:- start:725 stop:1762 length:1038 start_codon:yes stop_codon:yes gene_type:complete